MDVFAGLTVTFPSKSAFAKMHKSQEFLNRLGDAEAAFCASSLGARSEVRWFFHDPVDCERRQ
jgi:hypothetical protein